MSLQTVTTVRVTYAYRCCACDNVIEKFYDATGGMLIPNPQMPNMWNEVLGKLFCPRHTIEVKLDGDDYFLVRKSTSET